MKPWYRIENRASEPTVADVYIYDLIGGWLDELWGGGDGIVTAKQFVTDLAALDASVTAIHLHVNSPGGDCFAALAIANALRAERTNKGRSVHAFVEGLAASAASIVIMGAETIAVADNALVMVHNPISGIVGNAADLRKLADELDTVRDTIVATYRWHSELDEDDIRGLMDGETWMDADDALTYGFATEKTEGLRAAALFDAKALDRLTVPDAIRPKLDALLGQKPESGAPASDGNGLTGSASGVVGQIVTVGDLTQITLLGSGNSAPTAGVVAEPVASAVPPADPVDVLRLCREADCYDAAEALIDGRATLGEAQAVVARLRESRAAAARQAEEIRAACALARVPELADGYVAGGMTLAAVKAHLVTLTARLDRAEIDGALAPDFRAHPQPAIDIRAIYAARNHSRQE